MSHNRLPLRVGIAIGLGLIALTSSQAIAASCYRPAAAKPIKLQVHKTAVCPAGYKRVIVRQISKYFAEVECYQHCRTGTRWNFRSKLCCQPVPTVTRPKGGLKTVPAPRGKKLRAVPKYMKP